MLIAREWYSNHILITDFTVEASRVKVSSCDFDNFSLDDFVTFSTGFHLFLVIFLAKDLTVECVVGSVYFFFADAATLLTLLVILLTNGLVHESEVLSPQYFPTNLACNASGVVVLLVGDNAVPGDVVLADAALLLGYLVALGAVCFVVFSEELFI